MLNHHPPKLMESTLKMAEFDGPLATQGELEKNSPFLGSLWSKIGKTQKSHSWYCLIGGQSPMFRHPQFIIVVKNNMYKNPIPRTPHKMLGLIHKFGAKSDPNVHLHLQRNQHRPLLYLLLKPLPCQTQGFYVPHDMLSLEGKATWVCPT